MPTKDPRVDAYIEKSAAFAKPILKKLRALVHKGCPQVTETIKWGMPSFDYKGPLASMASFKQHCAFSFWKSAMLFEGKKMTEAEQRLSWGAPGTSKDCAKITSKDDLPTDAKFIAMVKKAAKLNDEGVKVPKEMSAKKPLPMPPDFKAALKKSKKAATNFEKFPPSGKREYIQWITEAKKDETRQKRLATAIEWISAGKARNWKYQKK